MLVQGGDYCMHFELSLFHIENINFYKLPF